MATLKRPKEVKFEWPQPPAPYPPSQRSGAFIGPSGVGKTTTAIAMLTGPYKDVYSRVYMHVSMHLYGALRGMPVMCFI